jgi:hypothetical protein
MSTRLVADWRVSRGPAAHSAGSASSGHRTPTTTQHYAKITPNTLSKAYTEAGYFARNVRTIEVLLDRDAVASGAAAAGEPWQYYDLGHGLCSYTFFEQCPHRMACAKCDFYTPKSSSKAQLLEARDNLQRTLASIPFIDDERAAVDDAHATLDSLLGRLATPAGATPRRARRVTSADPPARHRGPPRQTRMKTDTPVSNAPHSRARARPALGSPSVPEVAQEPVGVLQWCRAGNRVAGGGCIRIGAGSVPVQ